MKFAEIKYSEKNRSLLINRFNSIFAPFAVTNINILDADGYEIQLNLSENADEKSLKTALSKAGEFLCANGVVSVIGGQFKGTFTAEGKTVMALLALSRINIASEVVIIGGDYDLTETLLCILCPHINYLSLFTDEKFKYAEASQYFFSEYGINIQMISSFKHENFKNADVVINCAFRTENYDYLLKGGCLYYDIVNDERRLERIRRKRSDVRVVNSAVINSGGARISSQRAENALYAVNSHFKSLADGDMNYREKLKVIENIGLSPLTSI